MKQNRIIISAFSGGGGKTLLSLGIVRALSLQGKDILPFKKGPDYIDTAWLALASGKNAYNLDPYFQNEQEIINHFCCVCSKSAEGFALIEGNRGLYDGKDREGSCSTAELAITLECPVVLSVDCTKMTRTTAALVQGIVNFNPKVRIAGVVLNKLGSKRHENLIRDCIEYYCGIPVLGSLPRFKENLLPERHMGLAFDAEKSAYENTLNTIAKHIENHIDLNKIIEIAESASSLKYKTEEIIPNLATVTIGIIKDKAFWFYYTENIEALQNAGAEIVFLSLFDKTNWDKVDALYIGGGYPEMYAEEIASSECLALIKELSFSNMPIYAECGGFMLLADTLTVQGTVYQMASIFDVNILFHAKPQGLGYVNAEVMKANPYFTLNSTFKGHEFHYSSCSVLPDNTLLKLSNSNNGMGEGNDALLSCKTLALYTHIYAPANPKWAENFVKEASKYKAHVLHSYYN